MFPRVFATAILFTAFCFFASDADAGKKPAKKDEPAGIIEVYKGEKGWRYRIKNADGKTIAMPLPQMSWESKAEALKAIEGLKAILENVTPTEVKTEEKTETKKSADEKKTDK